MLSKSIFYRGFQREGNQSDGHNFTLGFSNDGARGGSGGSFYLGGDSLHRDRLDALIREGRVKIVQIGSAPVARTNPIPQSSENHHTRQAVKRMAERAAQKVK